MTMKTIIPDITNPNIALVYHCVLQVHSISFISKSCSWLDTASAPLICCKAILVTKDLYFVCLHNMYISIAVITNDIKVVTKRKASII